MAVNSVRFDWSQPSQATWEELDDGRLVTFVTLGLVDQPLRYQSVIGDRIIPRIEVATKRGLTGAKSLASIAQLPILTNHPDNGRGKYRLNADGWKIGQLTGEYDFIDDTELIAKAIIDTFEGVKKVNEIRADSAVVEASSCYDVTGANYLRADAGVPVFEQIRGVYDHVALLFPGEGRGGDAMKFHFTDPQRSDAHGDSEGAIAVADQIWSEPKRLLYFFGHRADSFTAETPKLEDIEPMADLLNFTLQGKTYSTSDAELATAGQRADSLLTEQATEITNLKEQNGTLKAKNQHLTEQVSMRADAKDVQTLAGELLNVWWKALPVLNSHRADSQQAIEPDLTLPIPDVMKLVLIAHNPQRSDSVQAMDTTNPEVLGLIKGQFALITDDPQYAAAGPGAGHRADSAGAGVTPHPKFAEMLGMIDTQRADSADPNLLPTNNQAGANGGAGAVSHPGLRSDSVTVQSWKQDIESAGMKSV